MSNGSQVLLHYAAGIGCPELVKIILERKNIDVNAIDPHYGSPLNAAAFNGCLQTVRLLLDKGADINAQASMANFQGISQAEVELTALYVAVGKGDLRIAELLLARGANVNAVCQYGYTPLHAAVLNPFNAGQMVTLLLNAGDSLQKDLSVHGNILAWAARSGGDHAISALLAAGLNPNTEEGLALQNALFYGNLDSAEALITAGADITLHGGPYGSPISAAACGGIDSLEFLVTKYNVEPILCDQEGRTPLHIAALNYDMELIEYLLDLGMDINHEDAKGWSAIHYAASRGTADSLKILLARISPGSCSLTAGKWSPLHLACRRNGPETLDLLIQYGYQPTTVTTSIAEMSWNLYDIAYAYRNNKLVGKHGIPKHQVLQKCLAESLWKGIRPQFPPYSDWLCDGCIMGFVSMSIDNSSSSTNTV